MTTDSDPVRLGVVEAFYGPPYERDERLALIEDTAGMGFTSYVYAPKDDPFHRQRWREPYSADAEAFFVELIDHGRRVGIDVVLALSPGLDWRGDDDHEFLVRKLDRFAELGATSLSVAWDDVRAGGGDLGGTHGRAVAVASDTLGPRHHLADLPDGLRLGRGDGVSRRVRRRDPARGGCDLDGPVGGVPDAGCPRRGVVAAAGAAAAVLRELSGQRRGDATRHAPRPVPRS